MGLTSASNTALPLLLGHLVDSIQTGTLQKQPSQELFVSALWVLGMIALVYVIREGLNVARRYLVENSCTRINRDISLRLLANTMKMNLSTLSDDKIGALHGRIFRSVDGLIRFLRLSFIDFLPALLTGLFALTAAVTKQPVMGLVMLGVVPLSIVLTMRQLSTQKGVRLQLLRDCEEIDGAVVEQLSGLEYIRVANTLHQEVKRLGDSLEKRRKREIRHHFEMSLFGCAKALNEGLFHIAVLGTATYYAVHGTLSFGDVLTFSILYLNVMAPLNEIHRVVDEGHESSLRLGDLLDMLAEPVDPSFETKSGATPHFEPGKPVIVVEDLTAEYITAKGERKRALDGIGLRIEQGETIGIAGRSGCGKSTWVKCMLRLTHPCGGNVVFGGLPLDQLTRADLARYVGYVGQNPFVFAGTIAENIAYGNPSVTQDDIERVARLANLHEEIMDMPGGYQAVISDAVKTFPGVNVSASPSRASCSSRHPS